MWYVYMYGVEITDLVVKLHPDFSISLGANFKWLCRLDDVLTFWRFVSFLLLLILMILQ